MSQSVSLPVVTGGVGASVPTTNLGTPKTLVATGVDGVIVIEASGDGVNFIPVTTFYPGQTEQIVSLVCAAMRVNAANGSANSVAVMAEPVSCLFGVVPVPPTNGPGAALDVSAFGLLTTVLVTQPSGGGTIEIQISEDGVNWTTAYESVSYASHLNAPELSANFIRAVGNQATAASITVCAEIPRIPVAPLGPDGVAFGNWIVWRPGATGAFAPGGNVVTTWAEAYALIEKYRPHGQVNLQIETWHDSGVLVYDPGGPNQEDLVGYAEVPEGTWDMQNVWLWSIYDSAGHFANLTFADNAFFINLSNINGYRLNIISKSTVSSPIILNGQGCNILGGRQELFCLTATAKPLIQCQGGFGGIFNTGNNVFSHMLGRNDPNSFGTLPSLAPVFDVNGQGFTLIEYASKGVLANTVTDSVGGGFLDWVNTGSDGDTSFDQPAIPGTTTQIAESAGGQPILRVKPITVADSPYNAKWGECILVDCSGGAVSIVAPSANPALGQTLTVKDASGDAAANNITVSPSGADTVEDGVLSVNGAAKSWTTDGAGNWVKLVG